MPIKRIDLSVAPGHVVQICACCGEEHVIKLNRGATETGPGPFRLELDGALDVKIDGVEPPMTVIFSAGDFPDFMAVTAAELAAKLNTALPGVTAQVVISTMGRGDRVAIESRATELGSSVQVTGGSARGTLGFPSGGPPDPCSGRPVLGASMGGVLQSNDTIALRRCGGCGVSEGLRRTWDLLPPSLAGAAVDEQRRVINTLAQHLKSQGWVHPDCASAITMETTTPQNLAPGIVGSAFEFSVPTLADLRGGGVPWGGVP